MVIASQLTAGYRQARITKSEVARVSANNGYECRHIVTIGEEQFVVEVRIAGELLARIARLAAARKSRRCDQGPIVAKATPISE